jgi:GABA permease
VHHYLVVAHKTLIGDHLLAEVEKRIAEGECDFHLLVPVSHPGGHAWSDGEVESAAEARLEEGIEKFRSIGATVDGSVGDANPVTAINDAILARRPDGPAFDEILISTLPSGMSKWLHLDVVTRARNQFDVPVTHLEAQTEGAS